MFWENVWNTDVTAGSSLSQLLNSESVTLESVLIHQGILEEAAACDRSLGSYLEQQLEGLVRYVIQECPEEKKSPATQESKAAATQEAMDAEEKLVEEKKMYAFVASELLASSALQLSEALFERPQLLDDFFRTLDRPAPLQDGDIAYFRKVFEVLLRSNFFAVADYLKGKGVIQKLVTHIANFSILELLRIISYDDLRLTSMDNEWLVAEGLVPALVSALADPTRQEHASNLLGEIALKCPLTELVMQLSSGTTLDSLLGLLTNPVAQDAALSLVSVLVQSCQKIEEEPPGYREAKEPEVVPELVAKLLPLLNDIASVLLKNKDPVVRQCGTHDNLGTTRLRVCYFFASLFQSGYTTAEDKMAAVQPSLLPTLFNLFFHYHWHNLLHITIERIFNNVLFSKHPVLMSSLFVEGAFLTKAMEAVQTARQSAGNRRGNLGHILRMLNTVAMWEDQAVATNLIGAEAEAKWVEFRGGFLAEENDRAAPIEYDPQNPPLPTVTGYAEQPAYDPPEPTEDEADEEDDGIYTVGYREEKEPLGTIDSDEEDGAAQDSSDANSDVCQNCGRGWEPGDRFCANCSRVRSSPLEFCGDCGRRWEPTERFCASCGKPRTNQISRYVAKSRVEEVTEEDEAQEADEEPDSELPTTPGGDAEAPQEEKDGSSSQPATSGDTASSTAEATPAASSTAEATPAASSTAEATATAETKSENPPSTETAPPGDAAASSPAEATPTVTDAKPDTPPAEGTPTGDEKSQSSSPAEAAATNEGKPESSSPTEAPAADIKPEGASPATTAPPPPPPVGDEKGSSPPVEATQEVGKTESSSPAEAPPTGDGKTENPAAEAPATESEGAVSQPTRTPPPPPPPPAT